MLAVLSSVILVLSIIYFKLIVPFFYWQKRNIFYVKPWTRFRKVFLGKESFAQSVRAGYNEYPDRRYYGSYQFMQPSLFVRDLELIKKMAVKDFEHFTDHSGFFSEKTDKVLGLNLFSLKGQKWKEMRSALSPAFTGSKMRSMFTLILENAENFTSHFPQKELAVVEMKDIFTKFTNDVIASCAFGFECNSLANPENEFYRMGVAVTAQTPWRVLRSLLFGFFPKVFEFFGIAAFPTSISDFFLALIKDAIKVREEGKILRPDMIHLLMEARKGRLKHETDNLDTGFATVQESQTCQNFAIEITDEVITAQALVFFLAGFTTSSSLLSFLSYELAINPDIQSKLQKEVDAVLAKCDFSYDEILKMKYLDQVVSEALRKYPPGYVLNRICVKDYPIEAKNENEKDVVIEKGCLVAIPVIALHYSEDFFQNPEKFDPERFSDENKPKIMTGTYMPFGLGPRNCIGSRFALLEIKVLIVSLLAKFEIVPVEKTVIPLVFAKSLSLEAKGGIWLGLKRRNLAV